MANTPTTHDPARTQPSPARATAVMADERIEVSVLFVPHRTKGSASEALVDAAGAAPLPEPRRAARIMAPPQTSRRSRSCQNMGSRSSNERGAPTVVLSGSRRWARLRRRCAVRARRRTYCGRTGSLSPGPSGGRSKACSASTTDRRRRHTSSARHRPVAIARAPGASFHAAATARSTTRPAPTAAASASPSSSSAALPPADISVFHRLPRLPVPNVKAMA
jgi:hypothetical protein